MDLRFLKLRVCEADLILLDELGREGHDPDWTEIARRILDRRRGVGALRLAVVSRSGESIWLRVFDAEGGREAALHDAALCAARWLLDSGKVGGGAVRLRSGGGELVVDVLDGSSLGISLGPLLSLPEGRELTEEAAIERLSLIEAGGERFEALPVGLRRHQARKDTKATAMVPADAAAPETASAEATASASTTALGPRAVAVFCEGGTKAVRAKVGSSGRDRNPPEALPVRLISRSELRIGRSRDPRLDALSRAALALGAASILRHADDEALVRSGSGALWAEVSASGSLYVAGRPEYVFQGDFHVDDPPSPAS